MSCIATLAKHFRQRLHAGGSMFAITGSQRLSFKVSIIKQFSCTSARFICTDQFQFETEQI